MTNETEVGQSACIGPIKTQEGRRLLAVALPMEEMSLEGGIGWQFGTVRSTGW